MEEEIMYNMFKKMHALVVVGCLFFSGCLTGVEKINTKVGVVNHLFVLLFENGGRRYFKMSYGTFHVHLISADGKKYSIDCGDGNTFNLQFPSGVVVNIQDIIDQKKIVPVQGAESSVIDIQFMCTGKEAGVPFPQNLSST